ncbi:MAG: serine hydrolase [bacterium]|nr:serine hydrolase [bacterium]
MNRLLRGLGIAIALLLVASLFYYKELVQLWRVAHLSDEGSIVHNFQHMDELFSTSSIAGGGEVFEFERGRYDLPTSFRYQDKTFDTEKFLAETMTTGLLVLHDDRILLERYAHGHSAEGTHIAWSVSKSFLSALFGIAVGEGDVRDIMQPVTDYVPELAGSGYDGVPIKHVLQMSSGVGFNEDYGDPDSDINRMGRALAMGNSLLEFAATLERAREPGTLQHYVSIDTQVLGTVLVRATGKSLAAYTSEKLWKPLGMESPAYWMVDDTGMGMAFGGLNASLRDFARFGRLYLDRGNWNGKQIVPTDWVTASTTPDAPHLMPGAKPGTDNMMGYGYQWWLPADWKGDFMALGVYNQMIYIDPNSRLVIARHAANRDFQRNGFEPTREALALWRKISGELTSSPPTVTTLPD